MKYKRTTALTLALLLLLSSGTALAAAETATPTASKVYLTATMVTLDPATGQLPDYLTEIVAASYLVDGNNYMKPRDIANAVRSFSVGWDGATGTISINSREPYKPDGSESTAAPTAQAQATPSTAKITLDGEAITLTGYNIGGNNYYKLRDVGRALDFNVLWYGSHNAVVIQPQHEYVEEATTPATPIATEPTGYLHSYPSVQEVVDMYASQNRDNSAYWGGPTVMSTDTGYDLKWDCYVKSGDSLSPSKGTEVSIPRIGQFTEKSRDDLIGSTYKVVAGQEKAVSQDIIGGGPVVEAGPEAVPLPEYDRSKYKELPRISIIEAAIDMLDMERKIRNMEKADGWEQQDLLLSFNVYEAQRVINTILKYAPNNPELWQDNDPSTGIPTFTITIHWDETGIANNMSFPFRDWELKSIVERPNPLKNLRIFNSDTYIGGQFTHTTYYARF